jgi:hypothetical protein
MGFPRNPVSPLSLLFSTASHCSAPSFLVPWCFGLTEGRYISIQCWGHLSTELLMPDQCTPLCHSSLDYQDLTENLPSPFPSKRWTSQTGTKCVIKFPTTVWFL